MKLLIDLIPVCSLTSKRDLQLDCDCCLAEVGIGKPQVSSITGQWSDRGGSTLVLETDDGLFVITRSMSDELTPVGENLVGLWRMSWERQKSSRKSWSFFPSGVVLSEQHQSAKAALKSPNRNTSVFLFKAALRQGSSEERKCDIGC